MNNRSRRRDPYSSGMNGSRGEKVALDRFTYYKEKKG
jgi:hypothetical protein